MDKEEILKYARIFSTAKGDTHKIYFVNENKTINEPDLWKEVLNLIDKLQEEIEFQKNQRKLWRDNYYQKIDQIYNEKELIDKEAEIMRDNTIKIFTAQDIIKAKFQVIDKLLGDSNE